MANPDAAPEGFVRVVRVAPRTPHFGRRVESGSAAPPLAPTPTHSAGTELFRAWAASVRGYMGGREQQLQQPAVAIEQHRRVQQEVGAKLADTGVRGTTLHQGEGLLHA